MLRLVFVSAALLSILASAALGAGEYQRTKDGKTLIWNADPKPDDMASWWGARDKDGYAKGVGELTWYTAQGTVYARYYGNMVRGKFDGPVNVHVKQRIAHAFFIDGKRMTGWAAGRATSRFTTDWRSALAKEKGEMAAAEPANIEQPTSATEPASAPEEVRRGGQQTEESPAEGATGERAKETVQHPTPNVQHSIEQSPAEGPVGGGVENAQPSTSNVEGSRSKTGAIEGQRAEGGNQQQENAERRTSNIEYTRTDTATPHAAAEKKPATTNPLGGGEEGANRKPENAQRSTSNLEGSRSKTAETEDQKPEGREQPPSREATARQGSDHWVVSAEKKARTSGPSSFISHASAAATQDHGSLAELAVPPASLRREPVVETPSTQPEADLAASPSAAAQLTTDEAVAIADSEARARGYDLSQYGRPKADYSKVKGKWSLVYDSKNPETADETVRRFRVSVDDASRKADINP